MKKIILSSLVYLIAYILNAQNIEVGFKPKDSAVVIDSIRATNLNTNQTVKLIGTETLTLIKSSTTGIGDLPINPNQGQVYPNPCDGCTTVCFSTLKTLEVNVQIFNAYGQLISNKEQILEEGQHRFSLQLPKQGIYYITVQKGDESLNYKVVSIAKGIQSSSILYKGSEQISSVLDSSNQLKSAFADKSLSYTDGNNIMYTLYSGKNATVMTDKAGTSKTFDVAFNTCADKDGRNYKTVTIGTQTWMAENLAYLPKVYPFNSSLKFSDTTAYYYVYDYDGNNVTKAKVTDKYKKYGVLYNLPAALKTCPEGWHLPSDDEWTTLEIFLQKNGYNYDNSIDTDNDRSTNNNIARSLSANSEWKESINSVYPKIGGIGGELKNNNRSGFSALPGGSFNCNGYVCDIGIYGFWWSSTKSNSTEAWYRELFWRDSDLVRGTSRFGYSVSAFSVRCVKD